MAVLLIAEHNNKELRPFTLNAATAASQIDSDVHAIIIGQNSADAAKQLSELPVVKKVLSVEGAHYENFTAENFAPVIVKLAENYSHIVCSANTFGKNLMPRIAAHLDTSQVSDIIKVISQDTFLRPIYAGNATEVVAVTVGEEKAQETVRKALAVGCLLYTSPSPRDVEESRMPSSA